MITNRREFEEARERELDNSVEEHFKEEEEPKRSWAEWAKQQRKFQ